MIDAVRHVEVAPALEQYIVAVAAATRTMSELRLGVSPRGSLALLRAARSHAATARPHVTSMPEDVKEMAPLVLAHRVILQPDAELQGRTGAELIARALQSVPVPRGAGRASTDAADDQGRPRGTARRRARARRSACGCSGSPST